MTISDDDSVDLEIETFRVVAVTIGENAVTQDELDVAAILMRLLARLERLSGSTVH